jgi:hypothetical protein
MPRAMDAHGDGEARQRGRRARAARRLVAAALLLLASPARGQAPRGPDRARLRYTAAPSCAKETTFRNLVASELDGKDPFAADAPIRVEVSMRRRGPASFALDLSIDDANGHHPHAPLTASDCTLLLHDAATIVALWLRPVSLPPKAPAPPATPAPPPRGACPAAKTEPPPAPCLDSASRCTAIRRSARVRSRAWAR